MKEGEIDRKINELKQQKEELMISKGKAYRCKECGNIETKLFNEKDAAERNGLCFDCWRKKVKERKREGLMELLKGVTVVDVEPKSNPYSSPGDVEKIVLEVNGKRYEVISTGYDEHYIRIREEDS